MRPESDPEVLGCYGDAKDFRVNPAIGKLLLYMCKCINFRDLFF